MDQLVAIPLAILTLVTSEVTGIRCYQCYVNPPQGHYYNDTNNLCAQFDHTDRFVVDCPYSTMCMKKDFHLDIQDGVRINVVVRDCALQKYEYQDYVNDRWQPRYKILEPYTEGCVEPDYKGERATTTRNCYCRQNLCNSASKPTHEGYTDIMGVILVFNLMKYIRSLR